VALAGKSTRPVLFLSVIIVCAINDEAMDQQFSTNDLAAILVTQFLTSKNGCFSKIPKLDRFLTLSFVNKGEEIPQRNFVTLITE
jgi:hypothetical protein